MIKHFQRQKFWTANKKCTKMQLKDNKRRKGRKNNNAQLTKILEKWILKQPKIKHTTTASCNKKITFVSIDGKTGEKSNGNKITTESSIIDWNRRYVSIDDRELVMIVLRMSQVFQFWNIQTTYFVPVCLRSFWYVQPRKHSLNFKTWDDSLTTGAQNSPAISWSCPGRNWWTV